MSYEKLWAAGCSAVGVSRRPLLFIYIIISLSMWDGVCIQRFTINVLLFRDAWYRMVMGVSENSYTRIKAKHRAMIILPHHTTASYYRVNRRNVSIWVTLQHTSPIKNRQLRLLTTLIEFLPLDFPLQNCNTLVAHYILDDNDTP